MKKNIPDKLEMIDENNNKIGFFEISPDIWKKDFSKFNFSLSVRSYLSNKRQGTKKTLKRSDVEGSTKKINKQKGTGKARHGSRYAPQFRGGGIAFGPTGEENYSLKSNIKFKKKVLASVLSLFLKEEKIILVNKIPFEIYKTKIAEKFLDKIVDDKKEKILIIIGNEEEKKEYIIKSFRNIPYIKISNSNSVNFYQISYSKKIILTSLSIKELEKRIS